MSDFVKFDVSVYGRCMETKELWGGAIEIRC